MTAVQPELPNDNDLIFRDFICSSGNKSSCCWFNGLDLIETYSEKADRFEILKQNVTDVIYRASCIDTIYEHLRKPPENNHALIVTLGFVYSLISLVGMLGNGLVIFVVLANRNMRTARNVYITNLAVSNFLLAFITVPFLYIPNPDLNPAFPYDILLCKVAQALPSINVYCSTLTICTMAIDRYMTVRRTSPTRDSPFMAISLSLLIWLFACILSLPSTIFYHLEQKHEHSFRLKSTGEITKFSVPQCTSDNVRWVTIYVMVIQCCFLYIIPLVVLTIFTILMTNFLKRHQMNVSRVPRGSTSTVVTHGVNPPTRSVTNTANAASRRSRTTHLLIAMATSYAVLWLPFEISSILFDLSRPEMGLVSVEMYNQVADELFKVLASLSICVNPFLYGFLNTNFNRHFYQIFRSVRRHFPCVKSGSGGALDVRYHESMRMEQTVGSPLINNNHTQSHVQ